MNRTLGLIVVGGIAVLTTFVLAEAVDLFRKTEEVTVPVDRPAAAVRPNGGTPPDVPAAPSPGPANPQARDLRELEVVTLLSYDAIPAIDDPQFMTVEAARQFFKPDERVLGISLNGEHHVYSIPMLSRHEIVNDVVGGVPVAVTW
jgi:hypothetical protein